MADHDEFAYDDSALDAEFTAFRTDLLDQVVPPGPDAVRRTVRHRRRVVATGGVTLALVLVIGPVAGYAALDRNPPVPPGPSVTDQVTPSPTPATSPTPAATPTPSQSITPSAPNGRINRTDLLRTKVDLPAWRSNEGCTGKGAVLKDTPEETGDTVLVATAYGDIDDDGATETVALVLCLIGQSGPLQAVAFERDESGKIITIGQVVRTDPKAQWLLDVEVRADGVVRVEIADKAPGGGWSIEHSQRQWRGYRWDGQGFSQSEGARTFPENPYGVNLVVTASNLVYGAPDEAGVRTGVVTVTVSNNGTTRAQRPRLDFTLRPDGGGTAASPGWYACEESSTSGQHAYCVLPPLASYEERKLVFHLVTTGPGLPTGGTLAFHALDSEGTIGPDFMDGDNKVNLTIR